MWLVALSWPERANEAVSSKMGFHGAKCFTLSCGPRPNYLSKDEFTVQGEEGPGAFISCILHVSHCWEPLTARESISNMPTIFQEHGDEQKLPLGSS